LADGTGLTLRHFEEHLPSYAGCSAEWRRLESKPPHLVVELTFR
jgi:hypothetical protein